MSAAVAVTDAVADSEQRFRQIAEMLPQLIWTAGPDGLADYHNRRWVEYSGLTPMDLAGLGWGRAVHPDDVGRARDAWQEALRNKTPYEVEFRFRRKDGVYRWFLARAHPVLDESGQITRWFGTTTDIDDQKKAEQAQQFLAEASKELSISLDYEATLRRVAKLAVPRLADWSAVDLLDDHGHLQRLAVEHTDPQKVALAIELQKRYPEDLSQPHGIGQVLRTGKSDFMRDIPDELLVAGAKDEEHLRISRNLGLRSYMVVPLKARGRILGIITLVHAESGRQYGEADVRFMEDFASRTALAIDNARLFREVQERVAQLSEAQRALQVSEERYRSLVEATSDIVWMRSPAGDFTTPQPQWTAFTGQTTPELLGRGWVNAIHPEDRDKARQAWQTAIEQRVKLYEQEARLRRHDGEYRHMLTRAVSVREPDGSVREWVGVSTDVTARKKAEAQIRELNATLERRVEERTAQLREAVEEIESFSYSVSHDLRAPLRHIMGFSQLLEKRASGGLDEGSKGYIRTISEAAQRGGKLVDDLLAFSRMGRTELKKSVVSLALIIDEARRDLAPEQGNRAVRWVITSLPEVQGDPAMLRVVFYNLLGNALKYTRRAAEAVLEIGWTERAGEFEIHIRDNGVGFDMQYENKLFGVFQRLHPEEQFEGTGIGLATVKRIVTRHGGRVWAESTPGQGATFFFALPKHGA